MSYKTLVADDEYLIRRGIIHFLKKYDEIVVVAEAEDGEMALEQLNYHKFDLVFVDINMPFLNGLQFIEKLIKIQPEAVIVIITGYDDFEYARRALSLGVSEYILKPIVEGEFESAVNKILIQINKKSAQEKYLSWAKDTLKSKRPSMIKDFIIDWSQHTYDTDEILEKLNQLSIQIPVPFSIGIGYFQASEIVDKNGEWDDELIYYAAENIAKEIYEDIPPVFTCRGKDGNFILISGFENKDKLNKRNANCGSIIEKYIPVKCYMFQEISLDLTSFTRIYQDLNNKVYDIKKNPNIIRSIKQYIEQNYFREEFSLIEVAHYINLSPQHVSRMFKKETGVTLVDYLTKIRINKAIELFHNDELKMYEIAEMVGYATQHYFSSVFKKEMGISPLEYRKNC